MTGDGVVRMVDETGPRSPARPGAPELGAPRPELVAAAPSTSRRSRSRPARCRSGRLRPVRRDAGRAGLDRSTGSGSCSRPVCSAAPCSPRSPDSRSPSRAMRPIASLTAAAREIATTRDPSRRPAGPGDRRRGRRAGPDPRRDARLSSTRPATETEQAIQAQREFVADASHELRTPLTSILANLELLEARARAATPTSEEARDGRLGASGPRGGCDGWSPTSCCSPAPTPGAPAARRECDLARSPPAALAEVRPVAESHRLELEAPAPARGRWATPTSCTAWS